MSAFLDRLRRGPCLLLDGGLGTELIARGLPPGTPPDLWTLERSAEVLSVHREYVQAGSDAIHANTFGANPVRLARYGLQERIEEINRTAVRLAREAGTAYVIADIGPTGEHLPPVGEGDAARWRAQFERQAEILAPTGLDAFHIETMTDVREALVALAAVKHVAPDIPVLASLTFERKPRGFFTIMGDPLGPSLARLQEAGADAVGANCSITSFDMRALAEEAITSVVAGPHWGDARLVFQPNAGQPQRVQGGTRYLQTPREFADDMASLLAEPRVAALGGCCGTDSRFVSALRARMT